MGILSVSHGCFDFSTNTGTDLFTISNIDATDVVSFISNGQYYESGGNQLLSNGWTFTTYTYITENVDYRTDINGWINEFIDLPINSWYKSLMSVIGVGFTNSTVMNVIYVMPVYILWVFIFDVVVDCFLVIIKPPHKLLNRLSGGEKRRLYLCSVLMKQIFRILHTLISDRHR